MPSSIACWREKTLITSTVSSQMHPGRCLPFMPPHDAQMRSPVYKSAMDSSPPRTVQNVCVVFPRMVGYLRQFADTAIPAESGSLLDDLDFGPFNGPILGRK